MKPIHSRLRELTIALAASTILSGMTAANAQTAMPPASILTPDKVETRIGTLDFKDGMPSEETIAKVYDNLDFTHAFEAFVNTFQGVSIAALHKGFQDAGVKDNEVLIFSDLMDASSLFLTANADTIYTLGMLDLTKGPMVLEVGPKMLGAIDDQWFRWVIDLGAPGADRGEGGKYLILPPGYEGDVPEGGYFVAQARTNFVIWFARAFMENNDPKPVVEQIKKTLKVYPYQPGGYGTPVAEFLAGETKLGPITPPPPTVFHEGSGKVMNTIPPNDYSYYEWLNEVVQQEPATALDAELMGPIAAIGIVKGKPFAPDARMKKILTEAVALANATSRTLFMAPRAEDWYYYPGSSWVNQLFVSGYEFETPIPEITPEGVKPFPPPATACSTREPPSSMASPASRPVWRCGYLALVRSTSGRSWTRIRSPSTAPRPTRSHCQKTFPTRTSGLSSSMTPRHARCSIRPSATPARAARAILRQRPKPKPTARRRSGSRQPNPRV